MIGHSPEFESMIPRPSNVQRNIAKGVLDLLSIVESDQDRQDAQIVLEAVAMTLQTPEGLSDLKSHANDQTLMKDNIRK